MKQQINLYQAGMRDRRPAFSAVAMSAALALCSGALLAAWLYAGAQADAMATQLQAVQRQEAAAAARLDALTRTLESRDDSSASNTLREALAALKKREHLLQLIDGDSLGNCNGFSASLRALANHRLGGLWLTRIRVVSPGLQTTLEGHATEPSLVPEYLLGLADNDALRGQRFDSFVIERPDGKKPAPLSFSMTSQSTIPDAGVLQ